MAIIADIEDLAPASDNPTVRITDGNVTRRVKSVRGREDLGDTSDLQSFVPGTQRVFVKTWGCSHNSSDSEYMAGLLQSNGYIIVNTEEEADIWVLNSCTVKNPAEDHFRNYVTSGLKSGKKVVVSGCVSQSNSKAKYLEGLSIVGVQQIDRVVEVVEETLKGNVVRLLGKKKEGKRKTGGADLSLPKVRRNPLIEIIPISTGCLNQCTYCKTKHARGELGSYPMDMIVSRAEEAIDEGVKEIWMTSEDTGAYGRDIGTDLPSLLDEVLSVIPKGCRLRLGMTNPPYILEHLDSLAELFIKYEDVFYSFLHIPVQSGSDSVLGDMKREYCRSDFEQIMDHLQDQVPNINIATDIICGFPTETEDDFEDTFTLVDKYRFTSLFINQFYPRPGTPAAKMKRIDTQIVKNRSRRLTELFNSYFPFEGREGTVYEVLVTEESTDKRFWVGHNQFYEQILIPKNPEFMGRMMKVKIVSTGRHFMIAEPMDASRWKYQFDREQQEEMDSMNRKKKWKLMSWSTLGFMALSSMLLLSVAMKMRRALRS